MDYWSLALLLGSFSRVIAIPKAVPLVTPVSGDREFTTQILSIASLPGITTLPGGMLVPLGFPAGEKQFEGAGLRVASFDGGTASLCFSDQRHSLRMGRQGRLVDRQPMAPPAHHHHQ